MGTWSSVLGDEQPDNEDDKVGNVKGRCVQVESTQVHQSVGLGLRMYGRKQVRMCDKLGD